MASMEEEAHLLKRAWAQRQLDEQTRRRRRLDELRQRLDPMVQEFAEAARRVELPGTPDPDPARSHGRLPEGYQRGRWVVRLFFWPAEEDYRREFDVDVWPDGRWSWRDDPRDDYVMYLLDKGHLAALRESFVQALSAGK